jgi:SAM-dependent methyltransferase
MTVSFTQPRGDLSVPSGYICPNCLTGKMEVFHEVRRVPVHSVLLMPTREVAMNYPTGDIGLGFCTDCGFISNTLFNPNLHEYSTQYEETQGFSGTFCSFHSRLAASLIQNYSLHGKTIVEIGCGKGEFLTLLCEMGGNRGIGFDPAFVEDRNPAERGTDVRFVQDFYSEKYAHIQADFFCCKMTLEHIRETSQFIRTVRQAVGDRFDTTVFFQVPDVMRVLQDCAFWDIYYEHCSYFSAGSLARVFREAGFRVLETWTDYDGQYLMITARPSSEVPESGQAERDAPALVSGAIQHFLKQQNARVSFWRQQLTDMQREGKKAVVWGSGSKGVAFLTGLGVSGAIEYVVDINPYRQGKFMAGTGQKIVGPEFLRQYEPNVAIVMNPVYQREIREDLERMGLTTDVVSV